jgi:DNA-binding CsgD family transcriptional regulator
MPWAVRMKPGQTALQRADSLSAREQMVAQLVLRGHSSFSIARTLEIAEGTVKNHRKSIYAKLGLPANANFSRFSCATS